MPTIEKDTLIALAGSISDNQFIQLNQYVEMLTDWNRRINLISRADTLNIWENHIFPSLVALKLYNFPPNANVADIGTGAGLPGIPLKIIRPDLTFSLIDSIRKKGIFLKAVIEQLGITNCDVINIRLQQKEAPDYLAARFDYVTARAVAAVASVYELAMPILKPGGNILLWKGESDIEDLAQCSQRHHLTYEFYRIPEALWRYSNKFKAFRLFRINSVP